MTGLWLAACGTGFSFLMTMLGAALVFMFKRQVGERAERLCLGFAAGVMCAAAVFSLLVPAMERLGGQGLWPALMVTAGFGFGAGLMLLADEIMEHRQLARDEAVKRRVLMMTAVTLHNIPEGMAVGLAFASAAQKGAPALMAAAALAVGIGVQNLPEGAAISLPLRHGGMSRMKSFLWGAASGAVEPAAGLLAVLAVSAAAPLTPGLMAFSAGAMLCVAAAEMIPEAARVRGGTAVFVLGYAVMMALDVALG